MVTRKIAKAKCRTPEIRDTGEVCDFVTEMDGKRQAGTSEAGRVRSA